MVLNFKFTFYSPVHSTCPAYLILLVYPNHVVYDIIYRCRLLTDEFILKVISFLSFVCQFQNGILFLGIPELNLPVLEPLVVPMIKLEQGSGSVKLRLALKDLKVYGLSQYIFREIKIVLDSSPYITGALWVPGFQLEGEYDIDGKILLVPLKGKGYMQLNTTNTMGNFNIGLMRKEMGGKNYLEAMDFELKLKNKDVKIKLDSLFGGSQIGKWKLLYSKFDIRLW
ncbi:hypothetical protein C0J52_20875 [Blattella germanica]|nr:hypothetical protein C0J52_20875 [Blattella germanica]